MTTRTRNEYLDPGLSEDDEETDIINDEDEVEDARNSKLNRLSRRNSKKRKVDEPEEAASEVSEIEVDSATGKGAERNAEVKLHQSPTKHTSSGNSKLKPLNPSQLASSHRKARKTGVVYLSRIPPFMRPSTIRHLLTPYGDISRLFLTPEPPSVYARRTKAGGNKKRSFIDGWVEFSSKKCAKICAETLNGEIIGGKKGGWYHDDIWNIKYLRGFKWGDLMEQVQGEEKAREGRMRAELQREQRERKAFLGNVEAAKREKGKETKRRKKETDKYHSTGNGNGVPEELHNTESLLDSKRNFERRFRQNEVKARSAYSIEFQEQPEAVRRVLGKIF